MHHTVAKRKWRVLLLHKNM